MGRRHPKPRLATVPGKDRGLITVTACSMRLHLIMSLPLVPIVQQTSWGRKLVLESYSPSVHIGKGAQIGGRLSDPDSTIIGDFAIVGWGATISCHLWMTSPTTGRREYITAPVKVGQYAMVGSGAGV